MTPPIESPSLVVHRLCGGRLYDECEEHVGRCWLCAGDMSRGQPVDDWAGANFTGQNRVRHPAGTHVCESCVFVASRISPVPGRPAKDGKKFGGNFRNYSHLYEAGWDSPAFGEVPTRLPGYVNASKGEKQAVRDFLRRNHRGIWFAAIADSGQKHVIPWAPMNAAGLGGMVLFDEQIVMVPSRLSLVDEMTELLTMGATKEEIGAGDYTPRAWQLCGVARLRGFESAHQGKRHGAWFRLALWLAQRDEETVLARLSAEKKAKEEKRNAGRQGKRKAADADCRGAALAASGVPQDAAGEHAQALGHSPVAGQERVSDVRDPGGMGDPDRSQAAGGHPGDRQLSLFG